jgi:hypothetical protein
MKSETIASFIYYQQSQYKNQPNYIEIINYVLEYKQIKIYNRPYYNIMIVKKYKNIKLIFIINKIILDKYS